MKKLFAFLFLFPLLAMAGDVVFYYDDFQGGRIVSRPTFLFYLDAPTNYFGTNGITRDRKVFTSDTTGKFTVTNFVPGNYRAEHQGPFNATTNFFNFPETNGTIYAFDSDWRRGPSNGNPVSYSTTQSDQKFWAKAGLQPGTNVFFRTNGSLVLIDGSPATNGVNGFLSLNGGVMNGPVAFASGATLENAANGVQLGINSTSLGITDGGGFTFSGGSISGSHVGTFDGTFTGNGNGMTNLATAQVQGAFPNALTNFDTRTPIFNGAGVTNVVSAIQATNGPYVTLYPSSDFHAAITAAPTNATILLMPGDYYPALPTSLKLGQQLIGIGRPTVHWDSFVIHLDVATTNEACIGIVTNNNVISGIDFSQTNTTGFPIVLIGGPPFHGAPGFTNLLVSDCRFYGKNDIFYNTTTNYYSAKWQNCYLESQWDFFALNGDTTNDFVFQGCEFVSLDSTIASDYSAFKNVWGASGSHKGSLSYVSCTFRDLATDDDSGYQTWIYPAGTRDGFTDFYNCKFYNGQFLFGAAPIAAKHRIYGDFPIAADFPPTLMFYNASSLAVGTVAAARGGAGTVNGILKANGSGTVSAATAETDYVTPSGAGTLANKTLTTPTIASFANATHNHQNSAGGGQLAEAALSLTDVTTANASTSQHGFLKKLNNDATYYMDGTGNWSVPAGVGGSGTDPRAWHIGYSSGTYDTTNGLDGKAFRIGSTLGLDFGIIEYVNGSTATVADWFTGAINNPQITFVTGYQNTIASQVMYNNMILGYGNSVAATVSESGIFAGAWNGLQNNSTAATDSVIIGGVSNSTDKAGCFLGGRRAKGLHDGSFVWADNNEADFNSWRSQSFNIRTTGGAYFSLSNSPFCLTNTTTASSGNQKNSPSLSLNGNGWKTDATAASQPVRWDIVNVPVQGSANPSSLLVWSNSINNGAFTTPFFLTSAGNGTFAGTLTVGSAKLQDYGSGQIGIGGSGADGIYVNSAGVDINNTKPLVWRSSLASTIQAQLTPTSSGLQCSTNYYGVGTVGATNGFFNGSGAIKWVAGSGSPESVVTAPIGSLYSRIDGGAGTTLYVKESGTGNTGWVAK